MTFNIEVKMMRVSLLESAYNYLTFFFRKQNVELRLGFLFMPVLRFYY